MLDTAKFGEGLRKKVSLVIAENYEKLPVNRSQIDISI